MTGSYVRLDENIFFGIHPGIVHPGDDFDRFVILTTPDQTEGVPLDSRWIARASRSPETVLYHPIVDRGAPRSVGEFPALVETVDEGRGTVYIACKGGHGRSGLVAAALYAKRYGLSYDEVCLTVLSEWRRQRDMTLLRPRIRRLGCPQTAVQKRMLQRYLDTL